MLNKKINIHFAINDVLKILKYPLFFRFRRQKPVLRGQHYC